MFDEIRNLYWRNVLTRLMKTLSRRGFIPHYAEGAEEARKIILSLIPEGSTVGVAGSVTIRELGVVDLLRREGFKVVEHWIKGVSKEESRKLRLQELLADVFLSSVNAITLDGRLIAVDGAGNRVAALAFGPRKVIVAVGRNKIVRDLAEGLWRIKNVAAPMNALRLGLRTPCAESGTCCECVYPKTICRATLILEACPSYTEFHVVLVNRALGF